MEIVAYIWTVVGTGGKLEYEMWCRQTDGAVEGVCFTDLYEAYLYASDLGADAVAVRMADDSWRRWRTRPSAAHRSTSFERRGLYT